VYGGASVALGLIGLRWGDFASVWQPVPATVPHRVALAYIAALALVLGGAATLHRRTARLGAVTLGVVYLGVALPWLRRVVHYPQLSGTWLGFFEQFALVVAAMVVYVSVMPDTTDRAPSNPRMISVARVLLGLCALSFGVAHFTALPQTAAMVPKWLPPDQRFWAAATGLFHLLAAAALLTGVRAQLAARLLAVMLVGFGALVWAPMLVADPATHLRWAGNAVNLAIAGAAWVVADALAPAEARVRARVSGRAIALESRIR
jgi:uncharacterized membrane protein YphA (DoxX/SURF4 family)